MGCGVGSPLGYRGLSGENLAFSLPFGLQWGLAFSLPTSVARRSKQD